MKQQTGKYGEELAVNYLLSKGYKIIVRNYRSKEGEIDIICSDGKTIVFVEVKTRRSTRFGTPEEAITRTKMQHIRRTALTYLAEQGERYKEIRFDVIAILLQGQTPEINHIEAAF
ncbi:MAG: YraN family protein [Bacillota bacterium]|nr:YraN family protein [Bacillota bacterium]